MAKESDWDFHLRSLSANARDSAAAGDPASDPYILQSVKKINEICKESGSEDLVARAYPQLNKLFQRAISASPQSQASNGLLLLTILQFFLDFGEVVLHDADPSLRTFFRSCLSREFADPVVAEATLNFLNLNKTKFLSSFPTLLPQFFPLLLKLIAWNGEKLEKSFATVLPAMMSTGSFLPLFPSIVDLPILVVALEKVEKSSGTLIGSSIASIQKSAAPEMLFALMDEAYTGSSIEDRGGDSGSDDNNIIDVADPMFLEILKDENDGLAERHWTSPEMAAVLQAAIINAPQSDRLRQAFNMTPRLLSVYFAIALRDVSDCMFLVFLNRVIRIYELLLLKNIGIGLVLITFYFMVVTALLCALIPILMSRNATIFPDKIFCFEVQKRLVDFMLAAFQRSPQFIALLKKPIVDRLGEAYDSPAKTELALHLCWAIGEHGAGGISYKDVARELFESLELLLYENLSSSRLGLSQESTVGSKGRASGKSSQVRLLCFVVTAIAKLATCHAELLPRARVSLAKVARSQNSDRRVQRRACDYLGLMNEPAICLSVLGPSTEHDQDPGTVNWSEGASKMISHIPFYLLHEQEGPPFHDFSFSDVFPNQ